MNASSDDARRDADDSFAATLADNRAEFLSWAREDTVVEASAWADIASMLADGLIRVNVGRKAEPAWVAAVRSYDCHRRTLLIVVWRSLLDAAQVTPTTVIGECYQDNTPRVAVLYAATAGLTESETWNPEIAASVIREMTDRDLTKVATGAVAAAACLGVTPIDMRTVAGLARERIERKS